MVRATIEKRLLAIYSGGSEAEAFNISQLSRETGAAYPHTHTAVNGLIESGLLIATRIGKSQYCTLNLCNELTRSLLSQVNAEQKRKALKRLNLRNLNEEVKRLAIEDPRLLAVILHNKKVYFIIAEEQAKQSLLRQTALIDIDFLTVPQLQKQLLLNLQLLNGLTLFGYERFLFAIAPIHERLIQNHARLYRGDYQ